MCVCLSVCVCVCAQTTTSALSRLLSGRRNLDTLSDLDAFVETRAPNFTRSGGGIISGMHSNIGGAGAASGMDMDRTTEVNGVGAVGAVPLALMVYLACAPSSSGAAPPMKLKIRGATTVEQAIDAILAQVRLLVSTAFVSVLGIDA
jgi:hypothetical protein